MAEPKKTGGTFPLVALGMGLKARLVEVKPDLAASWLAKNPRVQRTLSHSEVNMLARHIDSGEWVVNGGTIVFDTEDRLCDGQHRLAACIKTGKPITCLVVYGVEPKAFATMDVGRARNPRDALKAAGITHQTAVASACQILYRVEHGLPVHAFDLLKRVRLSPLEILAFYNSHKGLDRAVRTGAAVGRMTHNMGAAVACRWLFDRISRDASEEFFERVEIGDQLDRGHPVLLLRAHLMPNRLYVASIVWSFVLAWNATRKGEKLTRFDIRTDKPLPDLV